jgi:RNA polymerase sigma-70 factor, ECF subfamily
MKPKPQSRSSREIYQERSEGQVLRWPPGRHLIWRRPSTQGGVRAAGAAIAETGPTAEERVLLRAARMGHPTAFADLVQGEARRLRCLALRITRNREDAEDVVQDCFKRALMHFGSFRGESRFSTWLTRIAVNCALRKVQARRREQVPLDDSVESLSSLKYRYVMALGFSPEESYLRAEMESILTEEIARLRPGFKGPVVLCHIEGLIVRDAAKVLGISNSALKARLHRARLALRGRLELLGIVKNASENSRRIRLRLPRATSSRTVGTTRRKPDFGD